jgi:DNA-binding MarR family transcriptional regulator
LPASKYFPPEDTIATTTPPEVNAAPRLRTVIGRLSRRLRPTAAGSAAGLTPTRTTVLLRIERDGPIRLSELIDSEGLNPTLLSRVIGHLLKAGLVERSSDAGDRRAAWVKSTAKGRRLAERIRKERTDALNLALAELPDSQRSRLESALPALEQLAHLLKERTP